MSETHLIHVSSIGVVHAPAAASTDTASTAQQSTSAPPSALKSVGHLIQKEDPSALPDLVGLPAGFRFKSKNLTPAECSVLETFFRAHGPGTKKQRKALAEEEGINSVALGRWFAARQRFEESQRSPSPPASPKVNVEQPSAHTNQSIHATFKHPLPPHPAAALGGPSSSHASRSAAVASTSTEQGTAADFAGPIPASAMERIPAKELVKALRCIAAAGKLAILPQVPPPPAQPQPQPQHPFNEYHPQSFQPSHDPLQHQPPGTSQSHAADAAYAASLPLQPTVFHPLALPSALSDFLGKPSASTQQPGWP